MPAKSAGTVAFYLSPMNPKLSTHLPSRVNSALFAKHLIPGEPVVVLVIEGLGFTGDYDHQTEGRAFVFRHDVKAGGHTLRIPMNLWMQNKAKLARDLMGRRTRLPIITLVELSAVAPAVPQTHALENEGSTPSPETTVPPPPDATPESEPTWPIMYGEMPLHEAVSGILKEAGNAIRIKAVAHQLSVSEDDIRTALADPASTVEIANAGWVRLKPQETPAD